MNSNGTFAVANGIAFARSVTFANGSGLGGIGTFVKGEAWTLPTSFTVRPGLGTNAVGTLTVDTAGEALTFGNNTLEIDFSGSTADKFSLTGGGALNLSGATDTLVLRGNPAPGSYVIAEAASISGDFNTVDRSGLTRSGGDVVYQADKVLFVLSGAGSLIMIR